MDEGREDEGMVARDEDGVGRSMDERREDEGM